MLFVLRCSTKLLQWRRIIVYRRPQKLLYVYDIIIYDVSKHVREWKLINGIADIIWSFVKTISRCTREKLSTFL